jgi:hypothetical protein
MRQAGFTEEQVDQLVWQNPIQFFAQGGRLDVAEVEQPTTVHKRDLYQGNSFLRGQDPDAI